MDKKLLCIYCMEKLENGFLRTTGGGTLCWTSTDTKLIELNSNIKKRVRIVI